MQHHAKSIRPFIGATNFDLSRNFYLELGFEEAILNPHLSYFSTGGIGFYLQRADVKDWIDNTMIFMEVDDVERYWKELSSSELVSKYKGVRLVPVRIHDWGKECFLHDPSGILWHFGEFSSKNET